MNDCAHRHYFLFVLQFYFTSSQFSYSFGLVVCDLFCFPSNFLFVVDLSPQKGPMQRSGLNGRNSCAIL